MLAELRAESEQLREEARHARMQQHTLDKQSHSSISRDQEMLEETIQAALAMEVQ